MSPTKRAGLSEVPGAAQKYAVSFLAILGLLYALFAGLHTVSDPDLGWQLATGRWIVQHRSIPFTDVLSYTIHGQEWIYPVLSQILLYVTYVLGGYWLLSWVGAATTVATVALLMRKGKALAIALALLAVPMVAARTTPRAEMFTEVLFAAFVSILWHYHRSSRGPLWVLPLLMFLWANLHPGFIVGLGMCAAYVLIELDAGVFGNAWGPPLERMRKAAPWLVGTFAATFLNPWGPRLYLAILRQSDATQLHSHWINEWLPMRFTSSTLADVFAWREPDSATLWLMLVGIAAAAIALSMRRIVPAILLGGSVYLAAHAIRFRGPFAAIAVIIGGSIIADSVAEFAWIKRQWLRIAPYAALIFLAALALLSCFRVWDLASNRIYMKHPSTVYFGPGESDWFPERASAFLSHEHLPSNIFNDYVSGGFLIWTLSPAYADYIDGRAVPFGNELFVKSGYLPSEPLDSDAWLEEAGKRNINTAIFSLDQTFGAAVLPVLKTSCSSASWRPVYLDAEAAIFVRKTPETQDLINRLQVDCATVRFDTPPVADAWRGRAEQFHYYLNAAAILLELGRPGDALEAIERAEKIFADNDTLHYAKGISLMYLGHPEEGEQQLHKAVDLGSVDASMFLATYYQDQGRYADQVSVLERAADLSPLPPYNIYLKLGYAQIAVGRPDKALAAFDQAEKASPFVDETELYGSGFWQSLAAGRARAQRALRFNN